MSYMYEFNVRTIFVGSYSLQLTLWNYCC